MASAVTDINMAKVNIMSSKAMLDDNMMDYVAGGCGNCDFWSDYTRFMVAAAILTGNMDGLRSVGSLMKAYMSIFGKNAETECTDYVPGHRANPAYKNV